MKNKSLLVAIIMGFCSVTLWIVSKDYVPSAFCGLASLLWCRITVSEWEKAKTKKQ